ncbi:transporter substrate-binding domain-containing protein [Capilliphycus salinus ALCB114379]|uniref:transporter substrate-binding domain-containing protein n=1 Tax=Capilliphycus salinus TaxID=2768948 RepID=UPI0039A4B867
MRRKLAQIALSLALSIFFPLPSLGATILEEIKTTGVLKAGVREDAAPFGYRAVSGEWEGYCIELIELLASRLQNQLNLSEPIKIEYIQSTLETREQIVRDKRVHVECGPNTITRRPPSEIVYSDQFLATGVYLLVRADNQGYINPSGALENISIGVLPASLTERFITSRYSLAEPIEYPGTEGRQAAVKDVLSGEINAFASDGLLLIGELLRQPEVSQTDYALVPSEPLTCEFYGMILPEGDISWVNTINSLILVQESVEILRQLYGSDSPYIETTQAALKKCMP